MAKEQHPGSGGSGPSGAHKNSDRDQDATFFNPDGSIQGHTTYSHAAQAGPSPSVAMGGRLPDHIPPDMNPALLKRLSAEAAKSAENQADDLADAIYTKFMTLLSDHITAKGGSLTMDDVAEMGEEFRTEIGIIKDTFLNAVETYAQARERNRVTSARGQIFNRLVIQRFEHRLADVSGAELE